MESVKNEAAQDTSNPDDSKEHQLHHDSDNNMKSDEHSQSGAESNEANRPLRNRKRTTTADLIRAFGVANIPLKALNIQGLVQYLQVHVSDLAAPSSSDQLRRCYQKYMSFNQKHVSPTACSVQGCTTWSNTDTSYTIFPFPDCKASVKLWKQALSLKKGRKMEGVCELHFDEDFLIRDGGDVTLMPGALPKNFQGSIKPLSHCRMCGLSLKSPTANTVSEMNADHRLRPVLEMCLELNDSKHNSLPDAVCDGCTKMVRFVGKFAETCWDAQHKLLGIYAGGMNKEMQPWKRIYLYVEDTEEADVEHTESPDDPPASEQVVLLTVEEHVSDDESKEAPQDFAVKADPDNDALEIVSVKAEPFDNCNSINDENVPETSNQEQPLRKKFKQRPQQTANSSGPYRNYECETCWQRVSSQAELKMHALKHERERSEGKTTADVVLTGWSIDTIKCLQCRKTFKTTDELKAHTAQEHKLDVCCPVCGIRFKNNEVLVTMFNHDLRDPLLHITFRKSFESASNRELTNLAKAAVAGDEAALDTLTTWRPRTAVRNLGHSTLQDNYCFYACTQTGVLYYINQTGTCTEIVRGENIPIIQILWHPKQDSIVLLLEDITIGHYEVDGNGQITELDRVKLSGSVNVSGYKSAITWVAGVGAALAILTGDLSVRIWDIESNDNYVLSMDLNSGLAPAGSNITSRNPVVEVFTCVSYCKDNQTLSAGTNQGNLYTWRRLNINRSYDYPENQWQLTNVTPVRGTIKSLTWGITDTNRPCMMVNCLSNVFILKEQALLACHTRTLWATQKKSNELVLVQQQSSSHSTTTGGGAGEADRRRTTVMKSDNSIIHLGLSEINLVVTNGRTVAVYRVGGGGGGGGGVGSASSASSMVVASGDEDADALSITHAGSFGVDCVAIYLYEQNVVALGAEQVKIYSLSGVVLQEIFFNDNEGKPIGADLLGHFLTVFTLNGYLKLFDISRHEMKLVQPPKCAYDLFEKFGEIISAKANSTGTHLALTIANEQLLPDGKLYLWNLESNNIRYYEFSSKAGGNSVIQHLPINFFWDTDDPRMLACETKPIPGQGQKALGKGSSIPESQINILFVDQKSQVKELELIELNSGEQLINLCIPHVVILKLNQIERIPLRDFKGLEDCDLTTRNMVLNFSLNVAQENMDQAFSCIRSLKSDTVWTNLAKLCVHTGRLDVAKVCLGHLKRARSVRALRKALEDVTLENECKVAVLAIELGMISDAEALYKKVGRYDLLNKMYQAAGRFDEALEIAEHLDRVHLKNTYHKYAEWLKENGQTQKAIQYYEKTNNLMHNVSQLLIDDPAALKKYMQSTKDPELLKWWAQYIESSGDMEGAFKIYQKSEDWFSQVRILCFIGQVGKADEIARNSGDRAACYHLARYYENSGKFSEAIQFYTRAQTYGNAVRICKENDLQDDLWTVACTARPRDKASAAGYFEENGDYRRAVELYHRAGMLHKAVEMAFKSQQPESLQVIASELDANSDPELVTRCAEFFIGIEQNYKAVQLLANARQLEKALQVAAEHSVPLTETLAELLTPAKEEVPDELRVKILIKLGEILQEQGDYHSATKKFTQAGDKIRAMKSLLKSGDTEKIIFFAGMSRQKEVYVMAANYLQALNWQSDSKVLKNIVTFYTKGQAYNQLANFYANCAQAEIDEFRDYDKALKALQEAGKCLSRATPPSQKINDTLQGAMMEVRKVIDLQDAVERGEFLAAIKILKVKLEEQIAPPVRVWDLLALLVECLVSTSQYSEALYYLKQLAQKKSDWYQQELIERTLLDKLVSETGINLEPYVSAGRVQRPLTSSTVTIDSDEEEIQEEFEQ